MAAVVLRWGGVSEFEAEVAEGLVGFGEETLHLMAELVGQVIVLLLKDGGADLREIFWGFGVVAVARLAGP